MSAAAAGDAQRRTGNPLAPAWLSVPQDLDALDPAIWPEDFGRDAAGRLTVGGIPADELVGRWGSPLYVYSEDAFRRRARQFRDAFAEAFAPLGAEVSVYYAGKSFLTTEVVRWVREEGLNVDTASGGELAVALRGGMPPERIALHGNNKSAAEIVRALEAGIGRIVVDSLAEIELVGRLARGLGVVAPVMIRVTPGVHASTHEFIATAHEDQKFGLSLAAPEDGGDSPALQAVAACTADPALDLRGLHCHIGSQIFDAEGFGLAAERVLALAAEAAERFGTELPELDLGGGYGIAYTEADDPRPAREIAESLAGKVAAAARALGTAVPHLSIEPGRAISGPSGCTLYTVGTLKTVAVEPGAQRRYVSVDGGMSDNARPVLYGADYTAVLAGRPAAAGPVLSRVVGKHCESGDVVVRDVYLPEDLAAGDVLAVPATGAYCWALSSNYNWVPRPPVVAVRTEGEQPGARLIVRGETEDDLLARDLGA
ncbi:diaminopimelate decarboxylase [Kocuria flava]|uniref:diaminopimelate decarboxylase n=1 Tax=Kocuria flava TaxID=446860 RepID=UPI002F94C8F4